MAALRVLNFVMGTIKGTHTQYVRPDTISASEVELDRLRETTNGLNTFSQRGIRLAGISNINSDSSVEAPIVDGWAANRSYGVMIVEDVDSKPLTRYLVSVYTDHEALIGDHPDEDALVYINTSTKMELATNRRVTRQSDIIQRMASLNGHDTVVANTAYTALASMSDAQDNVLNMRLGATAHSIADSDTLNSDAMVAATLSRLRQTTEDVSTGIDSRYNKNTVAKNAADAAMSTMEDRDYETNDLVTHIIDSSSGQMANSQSNKIIVTLGELRRSLGHFAITNITTQAGDRDFNDTSRLDTPIGANAQAIANAVLSMMIKKNVVGIKFFATNEKGHIDIEVNDNPIIPMNVDDIQGINATDYNNQLAAFETDIMATLKNVILPRVMYRENTDIIVDINMVTTTSVSIVTNGQRDYYSIQTGTASAWSNVNISDRQLISNIVSQKSILDVMVEDSIASRAGIER